LESILLVDDEPAVSRSLARCLKREDYRVYTANSGMDALKVLQRQSINVVISDQRMPKMTGSQLFTFVKNRYPETIRIILSGYSDFGALTEAINQGGIHKFLPKPWNNQILRTEIRQALESHGLKKLNGQLSHLFKQAIESIVILNAKGFIESVNPAFLKVINLQKQQVIGLPINKFFDRTSTQVLYDRLQDLNPEQGCHGELLLVRPHKPMLPVLLSYISIGHCGSKPRFAIMFIDNRLQKENEQKIEYLAYYDELTQLPNRRLFNDHLQLALDHAERSNRNVGLLFIDLDGFKKMNDRFGHKVGDNLLSFVSDQFRSVIRKDETLARYGGDEFVVILPDLTDIKSCRIVAEKLIAALDKPFVVGERQFFVKPSIGISTLIDDNKNNLVRNADAAMYSSKSKGGNCYQFYAPDYYKKYFG